MKIIYEANVKLKIVLDSKEKDIPVGDIPKQEDLDKGIKEIILDELGSDGTCEIEINSNYELI